MTRCLFIMMALFSMSTAAQAVDGFFVLRVSTPIDVDANQDFLGLEYEFSFKRLIANIGGYRRISDGDDDWLAAAGLGFVF